MQSHGRSAGTLQKALLGLGKSAAGAPVTVLLVVAFVAVGAAASASGGQYRLAATARSFPEQWWVLLSSVFWARDLPGYLLGALLFLGTGVALEHRMGSPRFAVAAITGQVLGLALSMGFVTAARELMGEWTRQMNGHVFSGPTALVCAAAMAATATMTTLWRRRIRLVVFSLLLLLALYNGGFADLVRLAAATAGLLVGPVLAGRGPRTGHPVSSRHEGRVLVGLLVAVSAIGPVVAHRMRSGRWQYCVSCSPTSRPSTRKHCRTCVRNQGRPKNVPRRSCRNIFWFSATGQSFIAYRVIGGIALTLGPSVGPVSAREASFDEFNRHCTANG